MPEPLIMEVRHLRAYRTGDTGGRRSGTLMKQVRGFVPVAVAVASGKPLAGEEVLVVCGVERVRGIVVGVEFRRDDLERVKLTAALDQDRPSDTRTVEYRGS